MNELELFGEITCNRLEQMRGNIDKLREDIIDKAFLEVKVCMRNSIIRSLLDDQGLLE